MGVVSRIRMCADVRRCARMCALTGTRTALVPVCARPRLTRLPSSYLCHTGFGGTLTAPCWVVSIVRSRPQGEGGTTSQQGRACVCSSVSSEGAAAQSCRRDLGDRGRVRLEAGRTRDERRICGLPRRLERRLEGLLPHRRTTGERGHRRLSGHLRALRGHDDPCLPGPDQRQQRIRRLLRRSLQRRLEGLLRNPRAAGERRHRQLPRHLRALRRDDHPCLPGPDQRQWRLRSFVRRRLQGRLEGLLLHRRAAGERRHRQRPGHLRALRGDDDPCLPGPDQRQRRLRLLPSRHLQRRLEGLLLHRRAAGQRRHRRIPGRLRALRGDDHPCLPGRDQRQRRLLRFLRRRLGRRLEGLLPHQRAAGQRRHRRIPRRLRALRGDDDPGLPGEINGNGASDAYFSGASSDGSKVFFETAEQLVSGDTDSDLDVYERSGGTTTLVSQGQINGNGAFGAGFAGASRDGSKVFFDAYEQLVERRHRQHLGHLRALRGDDDARLPGPDQRQRRLRAFFSGASGDGSKVFFDTDEQLVSGDTDSNHDIYERSGGTTTLVSQGEINGNGDFMLSSAAPRTTGRRSCLGPTSSWSAATPTPTPTSTSAPGDHEAGLPRRHQTTTAPPTNDPTSSSSSRARA